MRTRRLWTVLLLAATAASAQTAVTPKETIHLFNGKDLSNFYTWLADSGRTDPDKVFSVVDQIDGAPAIRISGQRWGALTSQSAYANYRLVVEYRWGLLTWADRRNGVRDSGVLVHGQGRDGASRPDFKGPWMRSIECQVGEGIVGDFIAVAGFGDNGQRLTPRLTARVRRAGRELFYDPTGEQVEATRVAWSGRDPQWKDELGFRGAQDPDSPPDKWTRLEVVCEGPNITHIVNGKVVNVATGASLKEGKILLQSEGAEVYFRRIDLEPLSKNDSADTPRAGVSPVQSSRKNHMQIFDHVGVPTEQKQPNEMYVAATKVWVTDPATHPHKIEYLRYERDTPVTGPVKDLPHMAYQVDNLESAMEGAQQVLLGPFQPTPTLRVAFVMRDGAVIEYMENSGDRHWFKGK